MSEKRDRKKSGKKIGKRSQSIIADKYRLEKIIGAGAHAEVYQANIIASNKSVAVKIFYSHLHDDILRHIEKELKVISALSHPNLLKVIAFGRAKCGEQMVHYMVTPLMKNASLDDLIKSGELGLAASIDIALQIAEALKYMHSNNFIHRDVKPQNILLAKNDRVVLADFGIACNVDKTQTSVAGTMEYCPPEQLDSECSKADVRMDIYSLGITLYEMLTGTNPYRQIASTQGQAAALKCKYVGHYPDAIVYNDSIPYGLNLVIKKMIANAPGQRYQSMREVIQDLQPYSNIDIDPALLCKTAPPNLSEQLTALFNEAAKLRSEKKWSSALTKYDEILTQVPDLAQAYNYRGEVLFHLKRYERALRDYNRAISYRPGYYSAYCRRAHLYINMQNFTAAQADLKQAIELQPKRPEAFFYQAFYHKQYAAYLRRQGKKHQAGQQLQEMKAILTIYRSLRSRK